MTGERAWLERAQELARLAETCAQQTEDERQLAKPIAAALFDAGFFRLLLARRYGGAQIDPPLYVGVIEELARGDASTAWVICQTCGCSTVAAYLDPETAERIFRPPHAALAWGQATPAQAVAVEGGYRVTGTWSFLSGCRQASWVGGSAPVIDSNGNPQAGPLGSRDQPTFLFPVDEVKFIDVWQVVGLRGTGSHSFTVSDVFVPEARAARRDQPGFRKVREPLYCFRASNFYSSGFAAVSLGIAGRMLDDAAELARTKRPRDLGQSMAENAAVQARLAQAEGQVRASRAYLRQTLEDVWQEVCSTGDELTIEQRIAIRLASSHAIKEARQVAEAAYHLAGSGAIFLNAGFERRMRDMHAVSQQMQARDDHFETVGRFLLGLEPSQAHL